MTPLKKFLFILCTSTLMILAGHQISLSLETPHADHLTVQGHMALQQKDYQQAIALFQQAENLYEKEGNQEGVIGTQVNQAIVLDQAGHKHRACEQLAQTLHIAGVCDTYGLEEAIVENSIDNEPGMIGLQALSNLLIDIGYLPEAEAVIKRLRTLAPGEPTTLLAQLTLQNAEIDIILDRQKLSMEEMTTAVLAQIQQTVSESDRLLPQLLDAPTPILLPAIIHTLKTNALIDKTGISIEQTDKADLFHEHLTAEHFQSLGYKQFNALASTIDSLIQLGKDQQQIAAFLERAGHAAATQREQAKLALLQGQFLDSQTTNKQLIEPFYLRAAELATLSHHPILAYSSYHRLALLHSDANDQQTPFFQQAIDQLEQAKSTLAITPRLLPKLEYDIQSIFHDYMEVLTQQGKPIGPTHSTMKQWRIDSYLRCSHYTVVDEPLPNNDEPIIHITLLDNTIVTSIQNNGTEQQYFADKQPALDAIHKLLHELKPKHATPDLSALKSASQQTYESLLKAAIEENFTVGDTLQFNVDPALESLPMATLFDGERFLIENFPISYNAELSVNQDNADSSLALIGSMSIQNPKHPFSLRFPPLPEVELEASSIEVVLGRTYRIDNEEFTLDNFKGALDKQKPSIVHIATHGLFSANPRDTALVAWDKAIHPQTLGQLLSNNPPQLLVFSSCDTAQGGRLGIAGLALQSGAKNTVASLSVVDSRATYILMSQFYQYFEQGHSVEQSLRRAQRTLIHSSLFNHPTYWSPFILLAR